MSAIEWTDATWNPWVGCALVSPGCTNCYAMRDAWRIAHSTAAPWYRGTARKVHGKPVWTGVVHRAGAQKFAEPLRWRKPRMVFEAVDIMRRCPQHRFQILTKRAELLPDLPRLPRNVWVGVSVERQDFAHRLDLLRAVDASVRFVSAEPLLGPLDLDLAGIGWVIAGGESGPRRRPVDLAWLRSLRAQCATATVPFFLKQIDKVEPIPPELMVREWPRLKVVPPVMRRTK